MRYLFTFLVVTIIAVPAFADIMIIDDDDGTWNGYDLDTTPYTDACDNISLGYTVWNTTSSGDPGSSDMAAYDAVFWITGSTTDLNNGDAIPTDLASYYTGAIGHVFVEGGEVGFDCLQNDNSHALGLALGVEDWDTDGTGVNTLDCLETAHDIFTTPNAITVPIAYTRTHFGDIDGMNYIAGTTELMRLGGFSAPGNDCMSLLDSGGKAGISFTVATAGVTDQANLVDMIENIIDYMDLTPSGIESASLGEIKAAYK